ncbi:MAG: iron ABC transporter ATP-binding protein, partial [Delftia sp. 13_1_40CM_3_66_6]
MIEVRDLLKRHGGTAVLQELNFDVPERALTAIIGPNGAGKSTLLSLVSRLMPITAGKVRVAGLDVATTPTEALARIMAILRQDNQSTLRLTVRDLVGFGRFPHSKGRLGPEDLRHVDEAMEYLQLTPLAERFLDELSGGQRQRAYIAMVLCQDTPFILLDEPLNNLDMAGTPAEVVQD